MTEQTKSDRQPKTENQPKRPAAPPWRVPVAVEDIAETGQHFDLVADARRQRRRGAARGRARLAAARS